MDIDINRLCICPFEVGDRVKINHHVFEDCLIKTGVVIDCQKKDDEEHVGDFIWMVYILVDNGRKVGFRPSQLELEND